MKVKKTTILKNRQMFQVQAIKKLAILCLEITTVFGIAFECYCCWSQKRENKKFSWFHSTLAKSLFEVVAVWHKVAIIVRVVESEPGTVRICLAFFQTHKLQKNGRNFEKVWNLIGTFTLDAAVGVIQSKLHVQAFLGFKQLKTGICVICERG